MSLALCNTLDDGFDQRLFDNAVCLLGVFDGVHCGHRFLISEALRDAHERNTSCVLITFSVDPDELFAPQKLKKLMSNEARITALRETGVDAVCVLPFTREFAAQTPEEFLAHVFGPYAPASMHVGYDIRFGSRAAGSLATLKEWGARRQSDVIGHDLYHQAGDVVTATRIRSLLAQGDIRRALELLGHPYTISGVVEHGRGEGADMGFSTANLSLAPQFLVLGEGVYAGLCTIAGRVYRVALSVGVAPMFEDARANVEAHILDFSGDLYGRELTIDIVYFLRPMITFDTVEALIAEVNDNIEWTRTHIGLDGSIRAE